MRLGTKTLLFGVHQIFIHTLMVTIAWVVLYRSLPKFKEFICICIHDIGYWGKVSLKNGDGDKHPELGARLAGWLFGEKYRDFVLGHSTFYAKRNDLQPSKLMAADKYWHCLVPLWFYKLLSVPTGEFSHYRTLQHARQVSALDATDAQWWAKLQQVCRDKVSGVYKINKDDLEGYEK